MSKALSLQFKSKALSPDRRCLRPIRQRDSIFYRRPFRKALMAASKTDMGPLRQSSILFYF